MIAFNDEVGRENVVSQLVFHVVEGVDDRLKAHAAVQQTLSYFEAQQILIGILPATAAAFGFLGRRLDEIDSVPVIQLTVCDACDLYDLLAGVAVGHDGRAGRHLKVGKRLLTRGREPALCRRHIGKLVKCVHVKCVHGGDDSSVAHWRETT